MSSLGFDEDPDCRLLAELRATPALFEDIAQQVGSDLQVQQALRVKYSPELVRAALTLRDLRARAVSKFQRAEHLWFDPKGLEQATAEPVANYKAQRFSGAVADYCCGIGADAIALAKRGCEVTAVDIVPANCLRTLWNAEVYDVANRVAVVAADIATQTDRTGLLHIDPDRRPLAGKRVLRVEDCVPGLDTLRALAQQFAGGAIKLSPASNWGGKFDDVEIELISLHGECKEATIWFGDLRHQESYRATALPSGETLAADPLSVWTNVGEIGKYVFDPDPAIVRAGLIDVLAERLNLRRLDEAEEYLTGDDWVESPFVQTFEVIENLPNNDREIRAAFRRTMFGEVEIKCRHIRIDVEAVRRKLPLEGKGPATLIFTRQNGRSKAVLCARRSWTKMKDTGDQ